MYNKDKSLIKYTRDKITFAEELFDEYIKMRKSFHRIESVKYDTTEDFEFSKDGKEGFIAGVYIMMSLFMDI